MKRTLISLILVLSLITGCCAMPGLADENRGVDLSDLFSKRDSKTDYDADKAVSIALGGDTAECDSESVSINGGTVTITDEGTYVLSGSLNGMVIVDAEKSDKVQLVLNNVTIGSETSAALYVRQADKVFVTLTEGSENTLSNGGSFVAIDDNDIDAALFSKDDLTLNGAGTLTVLSPAGHGVVSKDDLAITGGTYAIEAARHGLSGKDSVRIADGAFTITADKDGIHSENNDDAEKGFVAIAGGSFSITSGGDGISASNYLQIDDGEFTIVAGGGSASAAAHTGDWGFGGGFRQNATGEGDTSDSFVSLTMPGQGGGQRGGQGGPGGQGGQRGGQWGGQMPGQQPQMPDGQQLPDGEEPQLPDGEMPQLPDDQPMNGNPWGGKTQRGGWGGWSGQTTDASTTDSVSCKGLKADGNVIINGGAFNLDTADDGVHSNASVTVNGGRFAIATGDDGMHADETLTVNGGEIDIAKSYEGLEGLDIVVNDGTISVVSSDDGLNAAGGNDSSGFGGWGDRFGESSGATLTINGGTLTVNAEGDGLDSNGALIVNGGEIYVSGPTNSGNGALDCGSSATINGGTIVAVGASGMAVSFGSGSTQGSIMVNVGSQSAGSTVTLTDASGNVLLSWTPEKTYQNVVVSCAGLVEGGSYTLTAGSYSETITLSSIAYGSSGGMGFGGGMRGGMGGWR